MNKYNEFMSHITVDDEMKSRVMENVMKHAGESSAMPLPVKRKAKISAIQIASYAVAGILVVGVAVFFATRFSNLGTAKSASNDTEAYGAEAAQMHYDSELKTAETSVAGITEGDRDLMSITHNSSSNAFATATNPEDMYPAPEGQEITEEQDSSLTVVELNLPIENYIDTALYTEEILIGNTKVYLLSFDKEGSFSEAVWEIDGTVFSAMNYASVTADEWEALLQDIL